MGEPYLACVLYICCVQSRKVSRPPNWTLAYSNLLSRCLKSILRLIISSENVISPHVVRCLVQFNVSLNPADSLLIPHGPHFSGRDGRSHRFVGGLDVPSQLLHLWLLVPRVGIAVAVNSRGTLVVKLHVMLHC
jgi:hypothetical protein